ncbi:hypothetical protein BGZ61DRAFT_372798 [Ilyonectria robusta]|uniref:uncharacterized protein n=1 Tax=Ilyonectria robusta TaxID=1079257 RepID=UPI001E8D4CC7|nr:uncharacterized protein BGZ61DRAFT_372798 [Ilyonectria robusta]KAH8655940.1 hypothetical protein BGZ61DRAFT_372798 [Ilyonectria robusta]
MIGTSFPEWIFIRLSILFFQYTPLVYVAAIIALPILYGSAALSQPVAWVLYTALLAEALFFGLVYRPYLVRLKQNACHPSPLSSTERMALFKRCMINIQVVETYLQGWFLGAHPDDIRRDNVREFLLWAFFEQGYETTGMDDDNSEATGQELAEFISMIEEKLGRPLKEGYGSAQSLRLTLDTVESSYRSLLWYMIIFCVDQFTHLAFLWHGFEYYHKSRANALRVFPPRPQELVGGRQSPSPQLSYWHRPHSAEDKVPVVFFHGIGIGLWTYIGFLARLSGTRKNGNGSIGIIAIEVLPLSFRLTSPIPSKADFLDQMTTIIDHHCWQEFSVVSHSYGSVLTTHMLHSSSLQHRIPSVALIDPVTIALHLPHVAYNFTRRRPKMANEWQLWYFASTDPAVALCLGRHFFWRENILWKDELLVSESGGRRTERKAVISLAGRDLIVGTAAVSNYLDAGEGAGVGELGREERDRINVVMFPKLDHAQLFDDRSAADSVLDLVRSNCVIDRPALPQ